MAGVKGRSGRKTNYENMVEGNFNKRVMKWADDNFDSFDTKTKISLVKTIAGKVVNQQMNSIELSWDRQRETQERAIADHVRQHVLLNQSPLTVINEEPFSNEPLLALDPQSIDPSHI